MTTQIVLPVELDAVRQTSVNNGEPAWLTESRVNGVKLAQELELPKLEKMKIERWDLSIFVQEDDKTTFAPHILIVAEANSRVAYVDNYFSGQFDKTVVHSGVAEVFVQAGAKVQFATVHNLVTAPLT